jgi:hypothetical protein
VLTGQTCCPSWPPPPSHLEHVEVHQVHVDGVEPAAARPVIKGAQHGKKGRMATSAAAPVRTAHKLAIG